MKNKNRDKTGKISYIFTRETMGMTLLLFCALTLIMLLARNVFADISKGICTFMFGAFGYASFIIVALLAYLGEWLVFEKKIKLKIKPVVAVSLAIFVFFMLIHAVTTRNYSLDSYGGYLYDCYANAANGWSGYSFGGAVMGIIVYPVAKLTTFVGAYVIFSALLLLSGYYIFIVFRRDKKSEPAAESEDGVQDIASAVVYAEQPASESPKAADHMYTVNADQEIVENRNAQFSRETSKKPTEDLPPRADGEEQSNSAEEEDDRFSRKNLGRKILFENDEFAAESYRRNMIFNENSYFNHPVSNADDYMYSFTNEKKPVEPQQTYTQNYQNEILNQPAEQAPSNYVYGEKPSENIEQPPYTAPDNSDYDQDVPDTADMPQQPEVHGQSASEERSENNYSYREEEIYREPERRSEGRPGFSAEEHNRSEEAAERSGMSERAGEVEFSNTDEKEEKETSLNDLYSIFGGESMRGGRQTERESSQRGERGRANLFDDDADDDVFGNSVPSERTENKFREIPRGRDAVGDMPTGGRNIPSREIPASEQAKETPAEKPRHVWKKYVYPSLDLLEDYPENSSVNTGEIEENKRIITDTLMRFKIESEVANVTIGPAITRYDVIIKDKTLIKRSLSYKEEIALSLMKENVNAYLNYSKGALSIEIPNKVRSVVGLKSLLASSAFINCKPNSLTFGLGKNVDGEVVCPDITKMPHLLVAGTTGSGKSICLSTLLVSLLYKYGPEELRLILVDPKQAEFIMYNKLPHLMINEILYDVDKVIKALNWAIKEMERRYALFKEMTDNGRATKNLDEYNAHLPEGEEKLPKVLIVLDEFGDLMLQAKKDIESRIIRLAQKSRACGIHLILATQRPSVDCITGLIKSNLPTRIGFKVSSFDDSRTIFDCGGAEKLLGKGDMYFRSAENPDLARIQGCFIDTHEVQNVTDFIKANNETYFDQDVTDFINKVEQEEAPSNVGGDSSDDGGDSKIDETFVKALKYCIMSNQASVSMVQRRFPVGYIKACKIIDWMEHMNYITPSEGSKPRKVLLSKEEFIKIYKDVDYGDADD